MIPSSSFPSNSFVVCGSRSRGKKSQEKIEKKGKNNGGSQLDYTSSQEYNQHSLHPDRSPSSNAPDLFPFPPPFIIIPTWTASIFPTWARNCNNKNGTGCSTQPKKKRREQILNRSTQNVMGHPPATSDQFFVVDSLLGIRLLYFKRRQLYLSKLASVWVLYDVVT